MDSLHNFPKIVPRGEQSQSSGADLHYFVVQFLTTGHEQATDLCVLERSKLPFMPSTSAGWLVLFNSGPNKCVSMNKSIKICSKRLVC